MGLCSRAVPALPLQSPSSRRILAQHSAPIQGAVSSAEYSVSNLEGRSSHSSFLGPRFEIFRHLAATYAALFATGSSSFARYVCRGLLAKRKEPDTAILGKKTGASVRPSRNSR